MKSFIKVGGLLLVTFTFFISCRKTLEEHVYSFYSPNNLYKTETDAENAITGIYGILHTWDFFKAPYLFAEDADHDQIVGPVWNMSSVGAGNYDAYFGIPSLWLGYYSIISQVNELLSKVPDISFVNDSAKNTILGQAYFFRGWSYFNLVRLWGGVPIRLNPPENTTTDLKRSSVSEVCDQAILDLTKADSLLPLKNSEFITNVGEVTKGAADAVLAKVYLMIGSASLKGASITVRGGEDNKYYTYQKAVVAGYENMDSKKMYEKSLQYCNKVIQSDLYKLQPTFMDIWGRTNKNNPEMIWELQTQDNDQYGTLLQYWYSAPYYGGSDFMWMAQNLYDDYQPQDSRALTGIFHQYFLYGAWMFYPQRDSSLYTVTPNGDTASYYSAYSRPFTKKYWIGTPDEVGPNVRTGNRDVDFPFMRYADVLLMYAEASNEVNGGPTSDAYRYLNEVRKRSNESDTAGLNQEQFRSLILDERGKEFYQENHRRFDLIRWGIFLPVMNKIGTMENVIKTRSKKNLLWPIPQAELNANKLMTQNPGW